MILKALCILCALCVSVVNSHFHDNPILTDPLLSSFRY